MKEILIKLIEKKDLDEQDMKTIVSNIEKNHFEEVQLGSILCLLQAKGVKAQELSTLIQELMSLANKVDLTEDAIDVCGTGGDGQKTFNISTATAIVATAAGAKVAKHGNKAISSNSGSFDVLKELNIDLKRNQKENLKSNGIGFFFAPKHHPVFANIAPIRNKLGIRTIFNLMGPLLNPAGVKKQLMGVYDPNIIPLVAKTMQMNGITSGMVVNGKGLDEITIAGRTKVAEIIKGEIKEYEIDPEEYNIQYASIDEIRAENKQESANMIKDVFEGIKGPARDIVLLNTAAALKVACLAPTLKEGIEIARQAIDSGKAMELMEKLR